MNFTNLLKLTLLIIIVLGKTLFANFFNSPYSLKNNLFDLYSNSNSFADFIIANKDVINFANKRTSIIANDTLGNVVGAVKLSGTDRNALITQVGNWPLGYSIDTETGEFVIADNANRIAGPLQYTICNLIGVCSTANITIDNRSVSTASSEIFTLKSEVVESCFNGNANTHKVRYTLTNVSGAPIVTNGEYGAKSGNKKIRIIGTNINVSSFDRILFSSNDMDLNISPLGYIEGTTIGVDEEIVFDLNYSFTNLSNEIVGRLELRYGNSTSSGQMYNPDITLQVSNTIYKTPNAPNVRNNGIISLTEGSNYTIFAHTQLLDAPSTLRFYDENDVEIPYDTPIDTNFEGSKIYSVTRVSTAGCESSKTYLTFSKSTVELPNPGEISLSNNASDNAISETTICQITDQFDQDDKIVTQNSITIYNKSEALGTYVTERGARYAIKYSWEVSYNEGVSWGVLENADGNVEGDTTFRGEKITLSNIKRDMWIRRKAQEWPESTRPNRFYFSNIIKINVQKNTINIPGGNFHTKALTFLAAEGENGTLVLNTAQNKFTFPMITTIVPSTVQIIAENGDVYRPGDIFNFSSEGNYTFTVKATTNAVESSVANCETYATISLTVYDLNKCKVVVDKIIASQVPPEGGWGSTLIGVVANKENAYDKDLSTHSTISIALGVLGLGTTWQNLYFDDDDDPVPAGTPLKVKLGQEYSGVQVAGGITVVGLDANREPIGAIQSVGEGALLDALTGDNVFEYTFVPTDSRGVAQPYKGVRVILGSLLAVGNNAVLYGAYYEKERIIENNQAIEQQPIYAKGAKLPASNKQENQLRYLMPETAEEVIVLKPENSETGIKLNEYVSDVSWGNKDIGLGVATALSSVVYPYLAVDNDPLTYAIFNKTVGLLNTQSLDVKLKSIARPGDEIELIITNEGTNLLSLDLGADFTVQRYMDDVPVGDVILSNEFKVINLNLFLFKEPIPRFRIAGIAEPFNRVVFNYLSGVQVNLGNQLYLHDVSIVPQSVFTNEINLGDEVQLCAADLIKISKSSMCTEFELKFVVGEEQEGTALDSDGEPIIKYVEVENQDLTDQILTRVYETDTEAYYEVKRLQTIEEGKLLLLKVQTIQNKMNFGAPQYINIKLENCLQSIINPTLNLDSSVENKNDVFK